MQSYTYYWNLTRFIALMLAFALFCFATICYGVGGGFAPSLDVANTEDKSHRELHEQERDRDNKDSYDRVSDNIDSDRESSSRDLDRAYDHVRDNWH